MRLFPPTFDIADKIQLTLSYLLRLSLIVAAIDAIITQEWIVLFASVAVFILTLIPAILERNYRLAIPLEIELAAVIFVYATLFLGEAHRYYIKYWWWDGATHASYGITMGIVGFVILYVLWRKDKVKARPITLVTLSFCVALAIGALWEIVEFTIDQSLGTSMQESGLVDTMWDLILDASGALIASVMGYLYITKRGGNIIGRIIRKITRPV